MTPKRYGIISISLLILVALTACIKDEKPNIEVDILSVDSPTASLLNVVIHTDRVEIFTTPDTDPADLTLRLEISEGATIAPDPSTVTDYSVPRKYTVTSEDREWSKDYLMIVRRNSLPRRFDFEHWMQPENMRYRIPYEVAEGVTDESGHLRIWACGNQAYNFLTTKYDDFTAFPTQPTEQSASGRYAAKLVTRLTGQIDRPIAAGNLFIGQFDSSLYDPRESTQFGLPFIGKPLRIKGRYRYRSGGNTLVSGVPDRCRIQAILYRTDTGTDHLNGYTIKDSDAIIARAELTGEGRDTPGEGFEDFNLEFDYIVPFDKTLSDGGKLNLAIIFSSSRNGDVYDGAEGSTMIVDEVEIICE